MADASKSSVSHLRSAVVVGAMTLLSRISGMLQSRLLATFLGVGPAADAFFVAFRLPNLLRRFTAEGTMTSAFLPTLSETEAWEGQEAGVELAARFLGTLASVLLLICVLGIFLMGALTGLLMLGRLAPGSSVGTQLMALGQVLAGTRTAPPEVVLTTALGRIMFPYLALVSLTAGLSAVLNLKGRFGLPASVSTFWNLAFMAFGYGCMKWVPGAARDPRMASRFFAVAVLVGGVVQLFVLWPSFRSLGYRIKWGFHGRHPGVGKAFRRMAPGLLGTGIHPINVFVSTFLASRLAVGSQTVLFNSNMMGELVLGLFSASVATVSLPLMSRLVDAGDLDGLRESLSGALRGTAFLAIPASVGMAVLARPIIALIFQSGRFDTASVAWTGDTLAFQCVGLLFIATGRILAQSLYALKDYRNPALAALVSLGANILFSALLMGPLGTRGMALANALASLASLAVLVPCLAHRLPALPYRRVLGGWGVMIASSIPMGLAVWAGARLLGLGSFRGFWHLAERLLPLIAFGSLIYLGASLLLKVPEGRLTLDMALRKVRRGRNG
nr:murein biosynthesis integral membrane protein MurJ [uncultured Holophaga sp.]